MRPMILTGGLVAALVLSSGARRRRGAAASCGYTSRTARPAPRSTRRRRPRRSCRSWASTTTSSCSTSRSRRTASTPIKPDLAESPGRSTGDGTELTFKLRPGREVARWQAVHLRRRQMHLGHAEGRRQSASCAAIRAPRGTAISRRSTVNGDFEATFHLKQPQPSFLVLLASGYSPGLSLSRAARHKCGPNPSAPAHSSWPSSRARKP